MTDASPHDVEVVGQDRTEHGGSVSKPGDSNLGEEFVALHRVITRLRRDCPWDRVQTHASLARYALAEAEELAEALEEADAAAQSDADDGEHSATAVEDLVAELGDVLLQVLLNAAIGEQAGTFTLSEVIEAIHSKMVRRHPHVFERDPSLPDMSEAELAVQWDSIKAAERAARAQRIAARSNRPSPD